MKIVTLNLLKFSKVSIAINRIGVRKNAVCHYIMSVRLIADFHWCIFTITHVGNWESEMLELFLRSLYVNQQEIGFTVSSQLELNHRE